MDEEDAHFTHNSSSLASLCDGKVLFVFFLSRLYSAIWNSKTRLLKVLYVRVGCLPNPCSETTNTSSQHRSAGVVCYQTFKLIGKNNFLISALF